MILKFQYCFYCEELKILQKFHSFSHDLEITMLKKIKFRRQEGLGASSPINNLKPCIKKCTIFPIYLKIKIFYIECFYLLKNDLFSS